MKIQQPLTIKLISAAFLLCMITFVPSSLAASGGLQPGAYSTTITLADIPPGFPPEGAEILVGTWVTEFTGDGTTIIYRNGEIVVNGSYTSSKSHFVIRDLSGPLACTDGRGIATGIYSWSFVNGELHITPVLDRCFGRLFVLTLRPLTRL